MGLAVILPLDRHIYFHKVTGRLIVVYSLIHTVAHLGNLCKASEFWYFLSKNPSKHCFHEFFRLSWQSEIFCFENIFFVYFTDQNVLNTPNEFLLANGIDPNEYVIGGNLTAVDWLFTNRPHYFGLIPGWANPTGVSVLVVLLVMSVCSMKWVRKGGYFEVFYFSHLLYVIYWVLLIFHAPNFWKWFIGPCVAFLIEKIFRMARSLSDEGKTWVTMGVVLPSKVVWNIINDNLVTYLLLKDILIKIGQPSHPEAPTLCIQAWWLHIHQHSRHCHLRMASIHHQFSSRAIWCDKSSYPSGWSLDQQIVRILWSWTEKTAV